MQISYHYNIKEGRAQEYAEFVQANEQVLRDKAGPGWTYLGTYFTVQGLGEYDCENRWEVDGYADLGSLWGQDEAFDAVIARSQAFIDGRIRTTVAKSVAEVAILE